MPSVPDRRQRLEVFFDRLARRLPVQTFEEAYRLLCHTLREVEDELTDIPYDPESWESDGRLYPPFEDSWRAVPGRPGLIRMRTKGHNVYIAANGAVQVRLAHEPQAPPGAGEAAVFDAPGADGKGAWEA